MTKTVILTRRNFFALLRTTRCLVAREGRNESRGGGSRAIKEKKQER